MTKILLVEDDQSLREIYGIRLVAEGYEIISAGDGEEALAAAVRERPDLIVSDVMMPKISGFDMLDILRSTPETQNMKVIMMTALSSEDQRKRGENLGADRYLVKSQVGIEDVVNVVHEVLGDRGGSATPNTAQMNPVAAQPAAPVNQPISPVAPADAAAITVGTTAAQVATMPVATETQPAAAPATVTQPAVPPVTTQTPIAPADQVTPEQAEHLAGESELEQIVNAQISQFSNPEEAEVAVVTPTPVNIQETSAAASATTPENTPESVATPAPVAAQETSAATTSQSNNETTDANQPAAAE